MFHIQGEPSIVTDAREHVLHTFRDLEFVEAGHKYYLHGQELPSVSSIVHRFVAHPFDKHLQAERYAARHGKTAGYWIREWECKAFCAASLGTKTHEYGESLAYLRAGLPELIRPSVRSQYSEELQYLAPLHPKEEAVVRFLEELPGSYHLVLNEAMVYSGKNPDPARNLREQICGTFDMLYYDDGAGNAGKAGFVILDYKTNNRLRNEYSRNYRRMLLPPFDDLYQEDEGLYTLQLNLYALMLEDIGLPVRSRRIVWLLPDGNYTIVDIPDFADRLRNTL